MKGPKRFGLFAKINKRDLYPKKEIIFIITYYNNHTHTHYNNRENFKFDFLFCFSQATFACPKLQSNILTIDGGDLSPLLFWVMFVF